MTESCAKNYCQDGLQVSFATESQEYFTVPIYGHYELQPNNVNGRPYFKNPTVGYSMWWDGTGHSWYIGIDAEAGQSFGFGYYNIDVFCPNQFSEGDWMLWNGDVWFRAGNVLVVTCNCIFICTKKDILNFLLKV